MSAPDARDVVTQYALDVLEGRVIAGKLVRQASERHMRDIERQGTDAFPYVFEIERAERVFNFFGLLTFTTGDITMVGKAIALAPFQLFLIGSLFAWVHRETGHRRFRKAYIQLGRKNGKSLLVSGVALYMLMLDGWFGSQVYATATHKEQAKIVWNEAKRMVKRCRELKQRLRVKESTAEVLYEETDSVLKPLSKDTDSLDGFNPHCGVVDEYHQHTTNQMVKLLEDGMVQQTQGLLLVITTAGFRLSSPCHEEYTYGCKLLEQVLENEEYFVLISQLDKEDKPLDERNWIKANPLVAASDVGMNNLRRLAREAQDKGGDDLRDFLTKSLNIWVDQKPNGYMSMDKWRACGVSELPELSGRDCYVGVDLSSKIDLTSVGFEFPLEDGRYAVVSHSFMPAETVERKRKTDKVPYDHWIQQGYITETPGAVVDYNFLMQYIQDKAAECGWKVKELCYDPYNATQFATDMGNLGYLPVEIRQGIPTLSEPTKNFRDLVLEGKVIHDHNPVLTWAVSNAVTRMDHNQNIQLDKSKATERIDPIAALINAHVRARAVSQVKRSIFDERGPRVL